VPDSRGNGYQRDGASGRSAIVCCDPQGIAKFGGGALEVGHYKIIGGNRNVDPSFTGATLVGGANGGNGYVTITPIHWDRRFGTLCAQKFAQLIPCHQWRKKS